MESRIMQVFYGNDLLPYKDKERTVHYPITNGAIAGSNNVTKIRFYVDQIGGTENVSWVVVSKLPNGKLGYEPISNVQIDEELGEKYIEFDLSSYYTSVKGDLYLALRGYEGEITFEENDDGVYEIVGDPLIQVTGTIKLPINYSPMLNTGTQVLPSDVDRLIASLSQYLKIGDGIQIFTATNTTTFAQLYAQTGTKEFILFYGNEYRIGRFRSATRIYMETISNNGRSKVIYSNGNLNTSDRVATLFSYNNEDRVALGQTTIWYTEGDDTTDLDSLLQDLDYYGGHDVTKPFIFKLTSNENDYEGYYLCQADTMGYPNCHFVFRQIDGDRIFKGVRNSYQTYDLRDFFNPSYLFIQTNEEYVDDEIENLQSYVDEQVDDLTEYIDNEIENLQSQVDDSIKKLDSLAIDITSTTTFRSMLGTHFIRYNGNLYLCSITQGGANYGFATIIHLDSQTDYVDGIAFDYYTSDAITLNAPIVSMLNSSNAHNIPNTDYVDNKLAEFLQREYTKVNTTTYPTLNSFLASTGEEGYIYLYPINVSDESQGYYQYIWEGSWVSLGRTQLDLSNYYTKSETDTLLNGKVDKTSSANKVYGTNDQGAQTTYTVDDFYDGNIARRDSDGSITVPLIPSANGEATSKKYVDDSVATKQDALVSGTNIKTLNGESLLGSGNIVYDDELDEDSENAVQNKVITAELEKKANVDGNYPTLTAGLADNLTPYSEDSGAEQENPFISNGTGTNNNTEIVTVGDYGLFKEKQGNTLAVNQWVNPISGSITFSGGEAFRSFRTTGGIFSAGSKVLISCKLDFTNCPSAKQVLHINVNDGVHGNYINKDITLDSTGTAYEKLDIIYDNSNIYFVVLSNSTFSSNESIGYSKCICSSLTQMFNGDIPQDLLDNPSHFSWYYNGSLDYNTGSLVNANGVKLVSTGRNIYNPSETYNIVIPNKPFFASKTTTITYYDKDKNSIGTESVSAGNTFTTPSNCVFISSSVSAITITPYYTDQEGGEGYKDNNSNTPIEYQYEQPYVVDTGSEILRKAKSVKDYKEPNGTIHRLVDFVDLGTLNWSYNSEQQRFYASLATIKNYANTELANLTNSKGYSAMVFNDLAYGSTNNAIASYNQYITIRDTAYTDAATFKTAMSGVMLNYELATETTEQGTPFAENLPINDYGMLYWLDENDNLVGVPQGCKIFYPTNYKGFVDDMYMRTDGDASKLVLQEELVEYVKQVDLSSQITDVAGLTYPIKKAYRIGNMMFLNVRASNSGSSIPSGTTLFTLSSLIVPMYNGCRFYANVSGTSTNAFIDNGNVTIGDNLPNSSVLNIYISYPLA